MNSGETTYSVSVTKPENAKGETSVYRSPHAVKGIQSNIRRLPQITNLQQLHEHNAQTYADLNCLGTRVKLPDGSLGQYEFKSYRECYNIARKVGSSLLNNDMAPIVSEPGYPDCRFIVVYERNCEEWVELDMACCLYGITAIPIFDVLGIEALEFIFKQTNVKTIFTSGDNINILISDGSRGKLTKLDTIVCLRGYTSEQKEAAKKSNLRLMSWTEFLAGGEQVLPYPKVTADTVFTLAYTSGTTGLPKGAILTHGNVIAAIGATEEVEVLRIENCKGEVHLSYLPIAHIFERLSMHQCLCKGTTIGFYGGDILKLSSDLQALRPTKVISVPRLYNKFYTGILAAVTKIAQAQTKNPTLQVSSEMAKAILQKLPPTIKDQFKMITGGKAHCYFTGSAPISHEVMDFLRVAFSAPILEGYGQTETTSGCFLQGLDDPLAGNMGPYVNTEFKLVDVPEMNYTALDKGPNGEPLPRGELCVKGPSVFKGYYREPEKTAECTDEQGWHHTGDIAMLLPNGAIKLIDRRKNIFKLSQGEYIAPEKIENIYLTNKHVAEAYVHGDSFRPEIVAVIVPDRDNLILLGKELGLGDMSFEELCQDARVVKQITEEINKTGKAAKLLRFEMAQNIYLEPKSFALSGLTTPSMKLKRHDARKHYNEVLTRLCNSIACKL